MKYAANAVKLLPPVPDPAKILCIGLNYRDHAIEGGKAIPAEPVALRQVPEHADRPRRRRSAAEGRQKVDYEAELVIVIGKTRQAHPERQDARSSTSAATPSATTSRARDWQFRGEEKQWIIGKTFDTFAPTGPVLVTADESARPAQPADPAAAQRQDDAELEHEGVHLRRAAPAVVPVAGA